VPVTLMPDGPSAAHAGYLAGSFRFRWTAHGPRCFRLADSGWGVSPGSAQGRTPIVLAFLSSSHRQRREKVARAGEDAETGHR
jgi:hypothetical protein